GGYPPPNTTPIPASQCNPGPVWCCNTLTSPSNPLAIYIAGLIPAVVNPTLAVGLSCVPLLAGV
ncbi:hypothetical protein BJV78DRAFT_1089389, partial [Lactifluus subvellereus]